MNTLLRPALKDKRGVGAAPHTTAGKVNAVKVNLIAYKITPISTAGMIVHHLNATKNKR